MPCYGISIAEAVARKQAIKWYTGLLARPYLPWAFDQNASLPNLPNGLGPASERNRPPTIDASPHYCTAGSMHTCMQAWGSWQDRVSSCTSVLFFFCHSIVQPLAQSNSCILPAGSLIEFDSCQEAVELCRCSTGQLRPHAASHAHAAGPAGQAGLCTHTVSCRRTHTSASSDSIARSASQPGTDPPSVSASAGDPVGLPSTTLPAAAAAGILAIYPARRFPQHCSRCRTCSAPAGYRLVTAGPRSSGSAAGGSSRTGQQRIGRNCAAGARPAKQRELANTGWPRAVRRCHAPAKWACHECNHVRGKALHQQQCTIAARSAVKLRPFPGQACFQRYREPCHGRKSSASRHPGEVKKGGRGGAQHRPFSGRKPEQWHGRSAKLA